METSHPRRWNQRWLFHMVYYIKNWSRFCNIHVFLFILLLTCICFINVHFWKQIYIFIFINMFYKLLSISINWDYKYILTNKYLFINAYEQMFIVKFAGYLIPKGWCVLASLTSIHMDEQNYDNPYQFNPWRWEVTIYMHCHYH